MKLAVYNKKPRNKATNPLLESTVNLMLSGLMGIIGGFITIPINAMVSWHLKRDEQLYKHRLDVIAKQRELLLQHKLELASKPKNDDLAELRAAIAQLEQRLGK